MHRRPTGLRLRLSWIDDPTTTMTVACEAAPGAEATLHVGPVGALREGSSRRMAPHASVAGRTVWTATARGLAPDTPYDYLVSVAENAAEARTAGGSFRTAPVETGSIRAGFLTDTGLIGRPDGNATGTARVYDKLREAGCTLLLGGGDYAYANADGRFASVPDAVDEWFNQAESLLSRTPFMPQYGNHEIYLEERLEDWRPRFVLPEGSADGTCYAFTVGAVRFVSFYAPGKNPAPRHLDWLKTELSSAERRRSRWCVVYHHEALYAHGYSHPTNLNIRHLLAPIYEDAAVDLVVNAHDQNYERTYPLVNIPHSPEHGSTDYREYPQGAGVVFLKSSPGGKKSEIGNRFSPFPVPQDRVVAVRDASGHHYSLIDADESQLSVHSILLPEDGEASEIDRFSILAD